MKTFERYHKEHPEIWEKFKETTLKAIDKGFKNYSSKSIFEIIRWHNQGELKKDGFKINNNYTADYARHFIETHPQYKSFFRTRKLNRDSA